MSILLDSIAYDHYKTLKIVNVAAILDMKIFVKVIYVFLDYANVNGTIRNAIYDLNLKVHTNFQVLNIGHCDCQFRSPEKYKVGPSRLEISVLNFPCLPMLLLLSFIRIIRHFLPYIGLYHHLHNHRNCKCVLH